MAIQVWLAGNFFSRFASAFFSVDSASAAGIDVGNGARYVAVRPARDAQPVRRFECFTADLLRLAEWLYNCGVQAVSFAIDGRVLESPYMTFWKNAGSKFASGWPPAEKTNQSPVMEEGRQDETSLPPFSFLAAHLPGQRLGRRSA